MREFSVIFNVKKHFIRTTYPHILCFKLCLEFYFLLKMVHKHFTSTCLPLGIQLPSVSTSMKKIVWWILCICFSCIDIEIYIEYRDIAKDISRLFFFTYRPALIQISNCEKQITHSRQFWNKTVVQYGTLVKLVQVLSHFVQDGRVHVPPPFTRLLVTSVPAPSAAAAVYYMYYNGKRLGCDYNTTPYFEDMFNRIKYCVIFRLIRYLPCTWVMPHAVWVLS